MKICGNKRCDLYAEKYMNNCHEPENYPDTCPEYVSGEATNTEKGSALDTQVGGSHYKHYKIQPYEFFVANQIPHHKAAIIRRIMRYDHETGTGLEDLRKIQHEVELIIELEGWDNANTKPSED